MPENEARRPDAGPPMGRPVRSRGQTIRLIIGYAMAAAGLAYVFYDVDWTKFLQSIEAIRWAWIPAAVLLDTLSYVCQGVRWHFLLRPQGHISVFRTTEAIYFGVFLNEVLPLRVGELGRGAVVARWMSKPFVAIIPSMALERLMEGIWVAIAITITALFIRLPKDLMRAGNILGAVVLAATVLVLYLTLRRKRARPLVADPPKGRWGRLVLSVSQFFHRLDTELRAIGFSWSMAGAFGATFVMYACQIVAYWMVMEAYGIHRSILVGGIVFLIVHLGTALPNAPANVGTYQFFCVVALSFFDVDKSVATGFSVVVFIILSVPLWALGAVAFARSGTTLAKIRRQLPTLEAAQKAAAARESAEKGP
jgi:uncharacterized protein (TIRG00374 family)